MIRSFRSIAIVAIVGAALGSLLTTMEATSQSPQPDVVETVVAVQPFQHGFMLWRQDNGQITVAYSDIRTKSNTPCQEVFLDTFQDQSYRIPDAPTGLTVPVRGFGWLYFNDPQLAQRLGYATADEVGLTAQIRRGTTTDDAPILQVQLSQDLAGFPNPLLVASSDQPGSTYCFARRGDDGTASLRTWMALQRFEHGQMRWRQDVPNRIEVVHDDTETAPEVSCLDRFVDTWQPGEQLDYGDLAIPGRELPIRGFGKVWLQNPYVRESLGYPIEPEQGAFAEISFEPFHHPTRGDMLVRHTVIHLASGEDVDSKLTTEGGGSGLELDTLTSTACRYSMIPHDH